MARGERYTRTYSSTPDNLTRPYVIPPLEEDRRHLGREARKRRREQAAATVSASSSGQSASAARRAQYAAEAQRRMAAAPGEQQAPMRQASAQPMPQASFARMQPPAGGGTGQAPQRSTGARVVGVVVVVIVLAVPLILALIGVLAGTPGSSPPEPSQGGQDGEAVQENFPAVSTDELIAIFGSPDGHAGEGVEAYAVVSSVFDDTSFSARLTGYQPDAETAPSAQHAEVVTVDETGLQTGDIIRGRFMVADDFETTYELHLITYETVEPYDLAQDVSVVETGRDEESVGIEAIVTNSADVEMSYSFLVTIMAAGGGETDRYLSIESIAPGETVTVTETALLFDVGESSVDLGVEDVYRY